MLFLLIHHCYSFSTFSNKNVIVPRNIGNEIGVGIIQSTRMKGLFGNIFSSSSDDESKSNVLDIPVKSVKMGGLRFALGLFLIGQQNNPVKGSWAANQSTETTLDMYYEDGTGMFTVKLSDKAIAVQRNGAKPSLRYLLNESIILHCLIDELESLATEGEDIKDEDRLIQFEASGALTTARNKLPARAE